MGGSAVHDPRVLRPLALVSLVTLACGETPPLSIDVDAKELAADGTSKLKITVRSLDIIEGGTVQVTASRGALASSTVAFSKDDPQAATVTLWAPLERELGRADTQPIDISARVVINKSESLAAKTTVTATAPTTGPPLMFIDADPPAAVVQDDVDVDISVIARRIKDGRALRFTTTAGSLADNTVDVSDGKARVVLRSPAEPADALVTVTDDDSGIEAHVVVRFVNEGDPLFDLTGTFVQIGPARVRLESDALTPNPQCVLAPSLVLVDFAQDRDRLEAHYTTCTVTFPPVTSIVGTVENFADEAFYAAIPVVNQDFDLSGIELGASYHPPPSVVVVGAELDDPDEDALPEDENDERVVDADEDGEPGVTVQNSLGGEQHIVYRNVGESKGKVRSSNSIVGDELGDLKAKTETSVFGVGGGFLPDTIPLGSVVEVERIDGRFASFDADADGDGSVSCQEAIDAAPVVALLQPPDTAFDCSNAGDE